MSWPARFMRLPRARRRMLLEAVLWLGAARLAVVILPFKWIALHLGEHMAQSPEVRREGKDELAYEVSWAVRTASRNLPWQCKCLVQAMAAKWMLKRRGAHTTLYLGLAKDGKHNLCAHAWLRSGDAILTGVRGHKRFTVVSTFAETEE